MKKQDVKILILAVASVYACLFFYILYLFLNELLPLITTYRPTNEWVFVLASAIPVIIVLAFLLGGNISKVSVAGIEFEFEFDKPIPDDYIELPKVKLGLEIELINPNSLGEFLGKGTLDELPFFISDIRKKRIQPRILIVRLDQGIVFQVLRQYFYALSMCSPLTYIIFLAERDRYLGFTTVEKFKMRFPRFGIELLLQDFGTYQLPVDLTTIGINQLQASLYTKQLVLHLGANGE